MRYRFTFMCVLALGLMGCSETAGTGGDGGTGGMPECESAEDCDDLNECTGNACVSSMCESTPVADGTTCGDGAGTCEAGSCVGTFACTEQGIRDAIAVGGGPHGFDCRGPQTVVTEAEIVVDNDVILDGLGNLTVDGNSIASPPEDQHIVFEVASGVNAELRRITVTGGACDEAPPCEEDCFLLDCNASIEVSGTLTMADCTVSQNEGHGIEVVGTLTLTNSTVSENSVGIHAPGTLTVTNSGVSDNGSEGIVADGFMTVTNSIVSGNGSTGIIGNGTWTVSDSTVSDNRGGGIESGGGGVGTLENCTVSGNSGGLYIWISALTVMNSTVSGNDLDSSAEVSVKEGGATVRLVNSTVSRRDGPNVIEGTCGAWRLESRATTIEGVCEFPNCSVDPVWTSNGYNIESPGNTCGFDQEGDQVNVGTDDLKLEPLQDNGGPAQTHALGAGSVAVDVIPADMCEVDKDQRGEPRPDSEGLTHPPRCDVGAFERQRVSDFCIPFTNHEPACYGVCEAVVTPGADPEVCVDGLDTVAECLEGNDCTTDTCEAEWAAWEFDCIGGP